MRDIKESMFWSTYVEEAKERLDAGQIKQDWLDLLDYSSYRESSDWVRHVQQVMEQYDAEIERLAIEIGEPQDIQNNLDYYAGIAREGSNEEPLIMYKTLDNSTT